MESKGGEATDPLQARDGGGQGVSMCSKFQRHFEKFGDLLFYCGSYVSQVFPTKSIGALERLERGSIGKIKESILAL